MSDPIALHSKPLSNPLDSSAINQPAAAGQFQQFSTQPHDSANRMPVRTDDTGKQSPLPERNIRQPVKDEFLSDQETMLKQSRQRLEINRQSLQAHKDRLDSLGIGSLITPITDKPTLANTAESPPQTGLHDTIQSEQAVSVSNAAAVAQDSITEPSVSSAKSVGEHDIKGGTIKVTARTRSNDNGPDTKVTTTSIVTKTVTTTTTETLHDQPASPTLHETLQDQPASPTHHEARDQSTSAPEQTERLKSLPGAGETTPAAEQVSEPPSRHTSRTSFETAKPESLSSTESADYQIASSIVVDPDTVLTQGRTREIIIAYGDKQKLYSRANVPENSTVRDLQEQIESGITSFRKDKKRSKMIVEISSFYKKEDGKEESPLYASYEEARQGIVKRQARPIANEIAIDLSTMLVEKERKADEKIKRPLNGLAKDEKPGDNQTMGGQIKDEQTGGEQSKLKSGKVEQGKVEQGKNEKGKNEKGKNEQTGDAQDNSDQPS